MTKRIQMTINSKGYIIKHWIKVKNWLRMVVWLEKKLLCMWRWEVSEEVVITLADIITQNSFRRKVSDICKIIMNKTERTIDEQKPKKNNQDKTEPY